MANEIDNKKLKSQLENLKEHYKNEIEKCKRLCVENSEIGEYYVMKEREFQILLDETEQKILELQ